MPDAAEAVPIDAAHCHICGRNSLQLRELYAKHAPDPSGVFASYRAALSAAIEAQAGKVATLEGLRAEKGLNLSLRNTSEETLAELAPKLLPLLKYRPKSGRYADVADFTPTFADVLKIAIDREKGVLGGLRAAAPLLEEDDAKAKIGALGLVTTTLTIPSAQSRVLPSTRGVYEGEQPDLHNQFWSDNPARYDFEKIEKELGKRLAREFRIPVTLCAVCSGLLASASKAAYSVIDARERD